MDLGTGLAARVDRFVTGTLARFARASSIGTGVVPNDNGRAS
jgi:hypothetical protein